MEIPLKKKYRVKKDSKSTPYTSRTGNRAGRNAKRRDRKAKLAARRRYLKSNQKVSKGQ